MHAVHQSPVTPLLTSNSKAPDDNSLASCVYRQLDQGHLMPSGILRPCRHLGRAMVASRGDLVLNSQLIVATMPRKQANSSCDWVKIQVQIQSQMQCNGHVIDTIRKQKLNVSLQQLQPANGWLYRLLANLNNSTEQQSWGF